MTPLLPEAHPLEARGQIFSTIFNSNSETLSLHPIEEGGLGPEKMEMITANQHEADMVF